MKKHFPQLSVVDLKRLELGNETNLITLCEHGSMGVTSSDMYQSVLQQTHTYMYINTHKDGLMGLSSAN